MVTNLEEGGGESLNGRATKNKNFFAAFLSIYEIHKNSLVGICLPSFKTKLIVFV